MVANFLTRWKELCANWTFGLRELKLKITDRGKPLDSLVSKSRILASTENEQKALKVPGFDCKELSWIEDGLRYLRALRCLKIEMKFHVKCVRDVLQTKIA